MQAIRWTAFHPMSDANRKKAGAPKQSDLSLFRERRSTFDVYTKVSNRVLDLGLTEQCLDCPDVAGGLVDNRSFGAA